MASLTRGGAGIQLIHLSGASCELRIPTGKLASNFTSELIAKKEALSFYLSHFPDDTTGNLRLKNQLSRPFAMEIPI
ncbi:hypothetical protein TNCV_3721271 [Trichonephila clavipes]|nr:hypothetical protein TNCV_3721271 [Trichonephila clavipes]